MTCEEFLHRLDAGDGTSEGGDALAHRRACPSCERAFRHMEAVAHELKACGEEPAPPFLHARIMAHVRSHARRPAPWWQRAPRLAWAVPVATALVVAMLGGRELWRGVAEPPLPAVGAETTAEPVAPTTREETAPAPLAIADAAAPPAEAAPRAAARQDAAAAGQKQSMRSAPDQTAKDRERAVTPAKPAPARAITAPATAAIPETEPDFAPAGAAPSNAEPPFEAHSGRSERSTVKIDDGTRAAFARAAAPPAAPRTCALVTTDGARATPVLLPALACPPAGVTWEIIVAGDGSVAVRSDGERRDAAETAAALRRLSVVPPGNYHLSCDR